jgi:hypothetical protein
VAQGFLGADLHRSPNETNFALTAFSEVASPLAIVHPSSLAHRSVKRKIMADRSIRPAEPAEAAAVRDLVRAAYASYVERIGKEPAPML